MSQNINFVKGEIFQKEEGKLIEFKREVDLSTSKNLVSGIADYAEKYIIGFLNAVTAGELYIGIDNSGNIVGIQLSERDRDEILKSIPNKIISVKPTVPMSSYDIDIIDVFDSAGNVIKDLNVIHIYVLQPDQDDFPYRGAKNSVWLYSTDENESYYKKGSNCFKLSYEQVLAENNKRKQRALKKEADKLDQELDLDPNNCDLLDSRFKIAEFMEDKDAMAKIYHRQREITPKNTKVVENYARAKKSIGDLEGAFNVIDEAIQSGISNNSILKNKGRILQDLGRWEEADQSYQQAYDKNTDDYTALTQIGIIRRKSGRYKESIQYFNDALNKAPNYRLAKYEKKATYYEMFKGGI